jgi:hypothetical protein
VPAAGRLCALHHASPTEEGHSGTGSAERSGADCGPSEQRERGRLHPSRLTIPEEVPSPTPRIDAPRRWRRHGRPRASAEVHELAPRCRGEPDEVAQSIALGLASSAPPAASRAPSAKPRWRDKHRSHPSLQALTSETGCSTVAVRWAKRPLEPCSEDPCFSCKSAFFEEPTSGLEPLTCSLRVIRQVLRGFARACKYRISRGFPLSGLPCIAPYCALGGIRVVSAGNRLCVVSPL